MPTASNDTNISRESGTSGSSRIELGKKIIMVRNMTGSTLLAHPFKIDYHLLMICRRGSVNGSVNLISQSIQNPSLAIISPGSVLKFDDFSDNFLCSYVLISREFLERMDLNLTRIVPLRFFLLLRNHPIVHLSPSDSDMVVAYFNLLYRVIRDDTNPYRERCALDIIRSFFMLAGSFISRNMGNLDVSEDNPLMSRLLAMIQKHSRQHRDVAFYAKAMSLSPNHLYKIVKNATGKTVHEWIDEYIINEAKSMLKTTDMTIQQISDELNFPSQSFFGKYFKRHTGMGPREYRK